MKYSNSEIVLVNKSDSEVIIAKTYDITWQNFTFFK